MRLYNYQAKEWQNIPDHIIEKMEVRDLQEYLPHHEAQRYFSNAAQSNYIRTAFLSAKSIFIDSIVKE